ncbi:exodeoxyribonuclease III [Apiospora arundinis]|uniref:Exodeoxyribonuclease III n=1 Tax=Apiospora arundinis TaxID=335852 RepID=A0ABR2IEH6_9PEZI
MKRSISPPPLKRQKRSQTPSVGGAASDGPDAQRPVFSPTITPTPGTLRIFSWNVNGIAPFAQPYPQKTIKSFFSSTGQTKTLSGRGVRHAGGVVSVVDVTTGREGNADNSDSDAIERCDHDGDDDPSKEGEASLRGTLKRFKWPQVLFLQEVKIKPGDEKTQNAVKVAVNDALRSERKRVDPHNAKGFGGKVYGVAAITRRDFMRSHVKEVRDVTWDREGRVQVIETGDIDFPLNGDVGRPNNSSHKLAIFNIYAVNGTTNAYKSTHTGAPAGTRHDRKLAFHADLLREARALESRGYQVIIAGDLNVAPDERDGHPNLRTFPAQHVQNRVDFNDKFLSSSKCVDIAPNEASYKRTEVTGDTPATTLGKSLRNTDGDNNNNMVHGLNGIDTFRHIHGSERRYTYHPRGRAWGSSCDRVDLILASRALEDSITNAGICDSPRDRGPSDHCPVWVEIGGRRAETDAQ